MDHFKYIYANRAQEYHRMIAVEDVDNNLIEALKKISPFNGKRILDLGSGSGRIPLLLRSFHPQMIAFDLNYAMLKEQQVQRDNLAENWPLVCGDMRALPISQSWADVVIAGWAMGHLRAWYANDWQNQMGQIVAEMYRCAAPGATLVIFETMTTGSHTPAPPNQDLAEYYAWLENKHGFSCQTLQTDYQFADVEQAVAYTEFFFGSELAQAIRQNGWARLPEWTGMWTKTMPT